MIEFNDRTKDNSKLNRLKNHSQMQKEIHREKLIERRRELVWKEYRRKNYDA